MTGREIARLLAAGRFRLGNEALLQVDVETLLRAGNIPYEREKILGPGERVDFLVAGSVAVELKIKAQRRLIYRQIERYAMHDCVESLVLVTASALGLPKEILSKPAYVVPLGRTGL